VDTKSGTWNISNVTFKDHGAGSVTHRIMAYQYASAPMFPVPVLPAGAQVPPDATAVTYRWCEARHYAITPRGLAPITAPSEGASS
jgi:hypothetical protein